MTAHRRSRAGSSPRLTAATAGRVLRQLRADHRTIAMLLVLPSALLGLLYLTGRTSPTPPGRPTTFDRSGWRCSPSCRSSSCSW